jgi:hypothetical protein
MEAVKKRHGYLLEIVLISFHIATFLAGCGGPVGKPRLKRFAADFEPYNLFYLSLDATEEESFVHDRSDNANHGQLYGQVEAGDGKFGGGAQFKGGYIAVDVNNMPSAFAFDGWIRLNEYPGESTLISQEGNFRINVYSISDPDRNPTNGIGVLLEVYDSRLGKYLQVADTFYDEHLDIQLNRWHHIEALYDGHFKGRIYVDNQINSEGIARYERNMNQPVNHLASPIWPREISSQTAPIVLGAVIQNGRSKYTFSGTLDEVRFSDIASFQVDNGSECPPNCRPGDHGATGSYHNFFHNPCGSDTYFKQHPPTHNYYQTDHQYWRWAPVWMHQVIPFDYRMPYIQNVTDHSAVVVWRRQCERSGNSVDSYDPQKGCVHEAMEICYGEAGARMSSCELVYPKMVDVAQDNYPDCQYKAKLDNLRPSTWYHYKVSEMKGEFDANRNCIGEAKEINLLVEPLTDQEGNEVDWRFKDCWPTGWVRRELASDAHFQSAPLALKDQIEIFAFGDTGPLVCGDVEDLRGCYWLENQRGVDTRIWAKDMPTTAYKYTAEYGETTDLWLSPGDLAQTKYNDPVFEAYLFGLFNQVWWHSWDRPQGFFNGMMQGVPLYAAPGNHEWEANWPGSDQCRRSASEYFDNLFPPNRQFYGMLNDEFIYDNSSYSFDYGNLHIVSLSISCDDSCEHWVLGNNASTDAVRTDQACYIAHWEANNPQSAWKERLPGSHGYNFDSLQISWLKRDLWNYKDDPGIWKIVLFHVPLYGNEIGQGPFMKTEDRIRLARLFEMADVDLILTGHRHHYNRSTTGPISSQLSGPTPANEHAIHLVVGTGGYVADIDAGGFTPSSWFVDDHIPDHVGIPRLWFDGNVLFLHWYSLKRDNDTPPPLEESCLFLKGVPEVNKSECLVPGNFPTQECRNKGEGDLCSYYSSGWSKNVTGRCIAPHTSDPKISGSNGSWGPDLRCVPLPSF